MENKKISVCIATYNGALFIQNQLKSILNQLDINDEVIISDDSSSDRTLEIISEFNDERIKVYPNQKFGNPIYNFENAIKNASGEFIFLSDQDDVWLEDKVTITLNALKTFDLVVSNAIIVNQDLHHVMDSFYAWRNSGIGLFKNLFKNSYLGCCMAFNRKILSKVLPFPKNIPMHDSWIGLVAEIYYKVIFIDEKLIKYRRHDNNATLLTKDFKSKESFLAKLAFRLNIFSAITKRVIELAIKNNNR